MPPTTLQRSGNILLNHLDDGDWSFFERRLERRDMAAGQVLLEAGAAIEEIWFPEGGVASLHDIRKDGCRVGIGIIGFEGFVGWAALLGTDRSPHEATIAIGQATALYLEASEFIEICQQRQSANALFLRYVQCFIAQMGRTILANLHEPVERRLARWLLMNQDRLDRDEIALTHEQLGVMLGVRRASVTDTLHVLEGLSLIKATRGRIIIRDRARLIEFAGESYGPAEAEYARVIARVN